MNRRKYLSVLRALGFERISNVEMNELISINTVTLSTGSHTLNEVLEEIAFCDEPTMDLECLIEDVECTKNQSVRPTR